MGKILVLFAGGTITMSPDEHGALAPGEEPERIIKSFPQIAEIADCDFRLICNIDSSNIQPEIWGDLASVLYEEHEHYDGFVIPHGTDTMAYTSSALSFALRDFGKPVVLTGGQKPITDIAPDGLNNFVNALLVAQMDIGEVCIVFGSKVLRGNRATKQSDIKLDAFDSPLAPPLGTIDLKPRLYNPRRRWHTKGKPPQKSFDNRIVVYQIFPGMQPEFMINDLDREECKGVVLLGFGPGNVPNQTRSLIPAIEQATKDGIPVLVTTQCSLRTGDMTLYEAGFDAMQAGAISALDMTDEAAITKFMWVLAQTTELAKVQELMHRDIAGELTV